MIKDQIHSQTGGDSSTNLQGQSIIIHQGISYSDAKEIALDVYKANFLQLSEDAADLARKRAEELTDHFLSRLKAENVAAIEQMSSPGMQVAMYEAQKQYAKTGDTDLQGLLVDILVERASTPDRDIHQIVLDESLSVAGKLTTEQMDALTVNFILVRTKNQSLVNLDAITKYINTEIVPFLSSLTDKSSCYEHLEYAGCGSIMQIGNIHPIERIFCIQYPGLFSKGFTKERFDKDVGELSNGSALLMPCFHSPEMFQLRAIDQEVLIKIAADHGESKEIQDKLVTLFKTTLMSDQEIKDYLIKISPKMTVLFDLWGNSSISKFSLTTVGIAIAQANFRRRTGQKLDLSIWVK